MQYISTNAKHGTPKQDNIDLCSSSSESVLNNFKSLPLPSTSTPLIKRPKNEDNLENKNDNSRSQVLELDMDLQMTSYDQNFQRIKRNMSMNYVYYKTNTLMIYKWLSCKCRI